MFRFRNIKRVHFYFLSPRQAGGAAFIFRILCYHFRTGNATVLCFRGSVFFREMAEDIRYLPAAKVVDNRSFRSSASVRSNVQAALCGGNRFPAAGMFPVVLVCA
jgi:hypothetical protein